MKPIVLLTGLLWLTALLSCRQNLEPQLPPATQTGQHTFGCLINGKVFVPGGKQAIFNPPLFLDLSDSVFDIRANYNRHLRYIGIFRKQVFQVGTYDLAADKRLTTVRCENDDLEPPCNWLYTGLSSPNATVLSGTLTITRLSSGGIVSGLFEFTLVSPQCDTVRVTEGRFDYRL